MDDFNIDTVKRGAEKNRRMLELGKVPTYFVIGCATSSGEAKQFATKYNAQHPRG